MKLRQHLLTVVVSSICTLTAVALLPQFELLRLEDCEQRPTHWHWHLVAVRT